MGEKVAIEPNKTQLRCYLDWDTRQKCWDAAKNELKFPGKYIRHFYEDGKLKVAVENESGWVRLIEPELYLRNRRDEVEHLEIALGNMILNNDNIKRFGKPDKEEIERYEDELIEAYTDTIFWKQIIDRCKAFPDFDPGIIKYFESNGNVTLKWPELSETEKESILTTLEDDAMDIYDELKDEPEVKERRNETFKRLSEKYKEKYGKSIAPNALRNQANKIGVNFTGKKIR